MNDAHDEPMYNCTRTNMVELVMCGSIDVYFVHFSIRDFMVLRTFAEETPIPVLHYDTVVT